MNPSYIRYIARKLSFPDDAVEYFVASAEKIAGDVKTEILMRDAVDTFEKTNYSYDGLFARHDSIGACVGLRRCTVNMLMLLQACESLERKYAENGYSDGLFVDSMSDLRSKLIECKEVWDGWGTYSSWHPGFFRLTRFALGRFQFEKREFAKNYTGIAGNFIKPGDTVLNFHIPSNGQSLSEEIRLDSYRRAKEFFFPEVDGPVAFACNSWLLWPEYESCIPKSSNIMSFRHDFTIIDAKPDDGFSDGWRIFGAAAKNDVSEWPRDTSLRRAIAEFTEGGGRHGSGYGVFFFDGERIIK